MHGNSTGNINSNPYHYRALQTFKLVDGGMDQTLTVTHLGNTLLPYGLGLDQTHLKSIGTAKVSAYSTPPNYLVLFRKATGDHFCLEPVSHPIDAFHLPGQAGLQMLKKGESLTLALSWRFTSVAT